VFILRRSKRLRVRTPPDVKQETDNRLFFLLIFRRAGPVPENSRRTFYLRRSI